MYSVGTLTSNTLINNIKVSRAYVSRSEEFVPKFDIVFSVLFESKPDLVKYIRSDQFVQV